MLTGGKPPVWAAVLVAAEDWGIPPWEIEAAGGGSVMWFFRWAEYKHWRNKAEEAQMKRNARRRHG
jgi:hypothetical protein